MEVTTDSRDQKAAAESSDLLGLYASSLYRKCSNCGQTGHNSRTCLEARMDIGGGASGAATRDDSQQGHCKTELSDVTEPVISSRKEVEDYSDASGSRRKPKEGVRRKGVAWTEEEHKNFLTGLQKLGKGNWRGISRHFVHTKSPTQVASHAQKYFIRQTIAGKRKRRSSLFDLVPEEDKTRETSTVTASTAQPVTEASITEREKEPTRPAEQAATPTLPMQGPDAMAWAYWYQSLMMQQNPMAWMNPMMTPMQTGKPSDGPDPQIIPQMPFAMTGGPVTFGACPPQAPNSIGSARNAPDTTAGNPNASNSSGANPAMAAFLAHQSQMAAFMAMSYMPQLQPDFMARYAAGMQFQAAQAMQVAQAAQSAANMQAQQDLSTPELSAEEEPDQSVEDTDGPSRMSKRTRISVNDSRLDFSNGSDQTEEFGNGALVRPKAQKATSYAELPDCLLDKRESPSNVNSRSKQSNSTRAAVQNVQSWLAQAPKNPPDPRSSKHGSAAGSAAATTFGNPVETSFSDATIREPDKATSRLQEPN